MSVWWFNSHSHLRFNSRLMFSSSFLIHENSYNQKSFMIRTIEMKQHGNVRLASKSYEREAFLCNEFEFNEHYMVIIKKYIMLM